MAVPPIQIPSVRGGAVHRRHVDGGGRSGIRHSNRRRPDSHDDVIGASKLQQPLWAVVVWTRVKGPVGVLPFIASIVETGIAPFLASIVVDFPFLLADGGHLLLDGLERFSSSDKANAQFVAKPEVLFVEKTSIHPDHDIHRGAIPSPDQRYDSADHLLDVVAIIAVPLAPPENRVHDLAFPNQLQRLKALDLLVRRIASLPLQSLVVIHHHRVERYHHYDWLGPLQATNKHFLHHPPERASS